MSQATDLIAKLKNDLLKVIPNNSASHTTINVVAGILDVAEEEFAPILEAKVNLPLLLTGLTDIENGGALVVSGAASVEKALKGPATAEST